MANGVSTQHLNETALVDSLVGNYQGSTKKISMASFTTQLLASAAVASYIATFDNQTRLTEYIESPLSQSIDLSGQDVDLTNLRYVGVSGTPVIKVGGRVDTGTSLTVGAGLTVPDGARSINYDTLTGPLAAGDWVAIKGHMGGAFTNNSGRNVFWGAMLEVSSVDPATKTIYLRQAISIDLDQQSVTNGTYWGEPGKTITATEITIKKVIPQRVKMGNIRLDGCFISAEYVIDSDFGVFQGEADARTKLAVSYATNSNISLVSRARQPNSGDHSLEYNFIYGGSVSYQAMSANATSVTTPAKGMRGNCISNAKVYARVISQGMQAATIQGIVSCDLDLWASDTGTYLIDRGVEDANSLDAFKLEFLRKCTGSVSSENPHSTAIELFNAIYCNLSLSGWRHRPVLNAGDGGIVSIKGAGYGNNFKIYFRKTGGDLTAPVVRYETLAMDYNGVFQSNDILDLDVETDYGQAFLSLGTPNGHAVGLTGTVLTGQLKGPAPLQCFEGSGGFISKGLTLISTDTHAAQVPNAGMEFYGCHFDVPVGRRAISSYRNPNVIAQNCTGSGPIHLVAQNLADLAAFNLRNFKGSDLQVNFVENLDESYFVTIFEPRQGGEWSIANGGEIFDGSEQLMSFADGTWEENDILWNSHSSLGPYSWRYEGGKWRRHSLRNKRGHCPFTTFGVSTGHTKLTYTATGLKKRDEVILQLASDPKGLLTQGYCAQDNELTVVLQNNTGAAVTLSDSIWYWTGVRHLTDQL